MKRKMVQFEEHEKELLDYAMQYDNFSDYVKHLVKRDMMKPDKKPNIYELYARKRPR